MAHPNPHHRRFAIPLHLATDGDANVNANAPAPISPRVAHPGPGFEKRQAWIDSYQSSLSASAARAASQTQTQSQPRGGGANPAMSGTSIGSNVPTHSAAPSFTVGAPVAQTPSSSSAVSRSSSSAAPSSSSSVRPTSSSISSTSSASPTTSSPEPSSSSSPTVRTITQSSPTPVRASPSVSADAAQQSTSSSGPSTGAIVGIVLAVLVGVVILGSALGWLYRKFASRGYKADSRWRKLDEDITPFPSEKYRDGSGSADDIYGGAGAAPVIGSGRALANSTRDGYDQYGRPMTEFDMYERNRAGVGSGMDSYDAPSPAHPHAMYGQDVQGRPYNGQAGRVPVPAHPYEYGYPEEKYSPTSARQLIGPGSGPGLTHPHAMGQAQHPHGGLAPMPLGRPAAPNSYDDIASREDYSDEPPSADYVPRTAMTNEWAGTPEYQNQAQRGPAHPYGAQLYDEPRGASPPMNAAPRRVSPPVAPPVPLPTLAPLSPLLNNFDLHRQSQPLGMYGDHADASRQQQKQLYGEVAHAAGFAEPKTPHTAGLNSMPMADQSGSSFDTSSSSFSAPDRERLPPMPMPAPLVMSSMTASRSASGGSVPSPISPPKPYEHGRPLSPLVELPTPSTVSMSMSGAMGVSAPFASSSVGHAREVNPFDRLAPAPVTPASGPRTLVAPHSAASSAGAMGYPSARYPPPSPGGVSVPGSVTDSPRRWSGHGAPHALGQGQGQAYGHGHGHAHGQVQRRSRGDSMFDEDDAYGGI